MGYTNVFFITPIKTRESKKKKGENGVKNSKFRGRKSFKNSTKDKVLEKAKLKTPADEINN